MAEVATGILHNVGNVLNSARVSSGILRDRLQASRVATLEKAARLLDAQAGDLAGFMGRDPRGQRFPAFLGALARHLAEERDQALAEVDSIRRNLDHIGNIVRTQQAYARSDGVTECHSLAQIVDDAIEIAATSIAGSGIRLSTDYRAVPPAHLDQNKVMQIMVNLLYNARDALREAERGDKEITVQIETAAGGRARISLTDNGVGIPAENLGRIFEHGFTTKETGNGFGLHVSANFAAELGGSLSCRSDGPGRGATFVLELPLASRRAT
jgi:signal transduction histidine kinase